MDHIQQFSKRVAERIIEAQHDFCTISEVHDLGLTQSSVEEFVNAVYYASLIPDEGRYPIVCLMSYRKDLGINFSYNFSSPYPPDAIEIAKLSHAVDPESHLCVLSENGKLMIGGIHITVINERRDFGYSSFQLGNPFKMWIRAPGNIEASWGGGTLIYEAGKVHEEGLLQHCKVMRELADSVKAELKDQTHGEIESLEDIFNDLAKAIVRQGHGGILVVTQEPDVNEFSSARRTKGQLLRQLLVRYWDDVKKLGDGDEVAEWHKKSGHRLTVASDTTMLEKCVRSIGHLAGMDGAIVMDYSCEVVALNAIISKDREGSNQTPRFVDQDGNDLSEEEIGKDRGSRHQSAVSYAKRVTNSFVFVISQDSSVTAIHNRGNGTVLYQHGLRVLD